MKIYAVIWIFPYLLFKRINVAFLIACIFFLTWCISKHNYDENQEITVLNSVT